MFVFVCICLCLFLINDSNVQEELKICSTAARLSGSYHLLERGCAADAVPLYQYTGGHFADHGRMTG